MINPKDYDYVLPEKNLALSPATPRDTSKLFVYDTKTDQIKFDYFYNLDKYLPEKSFLVLNNTKVLPARVSMKKQSGGKIIILFLINELTSLHVVKVIVDRKIMVGEKVFFDDKNYLKVVGQDENIFDLQFDFSREHLFDLLKKYGTMPIPPYLKKTSLKKDELMEKYQTIFAKTDGSSAAPTASLHFTEAVFKKLKKRNIDKYFVTLHVGLGTFAPLTEENIKSKKLHEEYYEVGTGLLEQFKTLKSEGEKLVAVGTTVVRTLESIVARHRVFSTASTAQRGPWRTSQKQVPPLQKTNIQYQGSRIYDKTDLFIYPKYDFQMIDAMITNFHIPKSSLMMLVEAFLQHKKANRSLVELYNIAIKNNFRFYSFGDAMLIL